MSFDTEHTRTGVGFWCPGCRSMHGLITKGQGAWGFNGNLEFPTFTPSLLVTAMYGDPPVTIENFAEYKLNPWPQTKIERRCHSFITDGRIQFLADCTHELAGQTVDMPDLPSLDE